MAEKFILQRGFVEAGTVEGDESLGVAAGILMQPDGARAYVSSGDGVSVIDLKTLEVVGRIDSGRKPDGLAWAVRK